MAKVLHIGKYFPPDKGGIESATAAAVHSALREGHEVEVVCFSSVATVSRKVDAWHVGGGSATIHRLPGRVISSQPLGFRYVLKGLALARHAHLVHLHFPNMLAALMALFLPRSVRLLVHWHSDVVNKGLLGRAFWVVEQLMLRRADAVVCTSHNYAQSSLSMRRFQQKVRVAPLGVPDPRKQFKQAPLDTRIVKWLNERRLILSVGRLVPYKGFDTLIDAVVHLPDSVAVVIVGEGPLKQVLSERVRSRGLEHRVLMAGGVKEEALHGLLGAATLFALASYVRSEAFGVAVVEALASGLPVVACDIEGSGVPWVNQDGQTGFNVPIQDASAFAAACAAILADASLAARLSLGARQRYELHFSEQVSGDALMQIYRELLA